MRTIQRVIDYESEESIIADVFFAKDESDIFKQRSELERAYCQHKKLWVCPLCRQSVKIRGRKGGIQTMHFAHFADRLDCPIKTGNNPTKDEILRMTYNGQKEGPRHNKLKNLIAEQISKDERFTEINVEKRFKGICKEWRKPDVSAIFNGKKVVFEIQLNTTFLSVITARNLFYQDNQIYILWIFDYKNIDDMRFMEKDIFYPNHHNAFFINESSKDGHFKIFCRYQEPIIVNESIKDVWQLREIDFGDLRFSPDYQVYWFDYERKKKSLVEEVDRRRLLEFGNVWRSASHEERPRLLDRHSHFLRQCKNYDSRELSNLLDCLYSIKFKEVIGYNFKGVIQVIHKYLDNDMGRNSHFGEYIFKAIRVYARKDIREEDRTRKLRNKAENYRRKMFKQSDKYDLFLKWIFPELFLEEMKI